MNEINVQFSSEGLIRHVNCNLTMVTRMTFEPIRMLVLLPIILCIDADFATVQFSLINCHFLIVSMLKTNFYFLGRSTVFAGQ